jgi:hypothetical protein
VLGSRKVLSLFKVRVQGSTLNEKLQVSLR